MDDRIWVVFLASFFLVAIALFALGYIQVVSKDADDFDELVHEAKVATVNYIAALNDATGLIKASYASTVSMRRSHYASRFIRVRQRSTPLRNGIRAVKNREEQLRASEQTL